jgi:hypothetical protein
MIGRGGVGREGKGRPKLRQDDNIRIDLRYVKWEGGDLIHL